MNKQFVNVWVLNTDLKRLRAKGLAKLPPLTRAIIAGWKRGSPVDSLVFSNNLNLLGRQPANELLGRGRSWVENYAQFLEESLTGKKTETETNSQSVRHVKLTRKNPSATILDVFEAPGHGRQAYTLFHLDTQEFEDGGTLKIQITVGSSEAAGSFDLFLEIAKIPTEGIPRSTASAYGVAANTSRQIIHRFEKGQIFQFGATGDWSAIEGSHNAFTAKITVSPNK